MARLIFLLENSIIKPLFFRAASRQWIPSFFAFPQATVKLEGWADGRNKVSSSLNVIEHCQGNAELCAAFCGSVAVTRWTTVQEPLLWHKADVQGTEVIDNVTPIMCPSVKWYIKSTECGDSFKMAEITFISLLTQYNTQKSCVIIVVLCVRFRARARLGCPGRAVLAGALYTPTLGKDSCCRKLSLFF